MFAGQVGAAFLPFHHLALDDHLRCDAGMIGARDPERILAAQARMADENILQRHVECMADVEAARHIRRRHDDRERRRVGTRGAERIGRLPMRVPARLDGGRVEGLGEFGHGGAA